MVPTPAYRVTLFVPSRNIEDIYKALEATSILRFGNYGDVTWTSSEGTERFTAFEGANPKAGNVGASGEVPSRQIIFSVPRDRSGLKKVLDAIRAVHPWENPVIYVDETEVFV